MENNQMEKNMLYLILRVIDGENLDPFLFTTYDAEYAKLKELFEVELDSGEAYCEEDTGLLDWGFTVAFHSGWLNANIVCVPNPGVLVGLPVGRFRANLKSIRRQGCSVARAHVKMGAG